MGEKTANPAKTCIQSCRHKNILCTQNSKFFKNLLPEIAKKTSKPKNRDLNRG